MLTQLHANKRAQLVIGLLTGIVFGFLLDRGGVTRFDTILNQLLLRDFTVVKLMLSASVTGMIGVYAMRSLGWVRLQPKPGSVGTSVVGGLIFGVAFAVLGYCPGTVVGAAGRGSIDALIGGGIGILFGSWLFATFYPRLEKPILLKGNFGPLTLPELFKVKNPWIVVVPAALILIGVLVGLEMAGL